MKAIIDLLARLFTVPTAPADPVPSSGDTAVLERTGGPVRHDGSGCVYDIDETAVLFPSDRAGWFGATTEVLPRPGAGPGVARRRGGRHRGDQVSAVDDHVPKHEAVNGRDRFRPDNYVEATQPMPILEKD